MIEIAFCDLKNVTSPLWRYTKCNFMEALL